MRSVHRTSQSVIDPSVTRKVLSKRVLTGLDVCCRHAALHEGGCPLILLLIFADLCDFHILVEVAPFVPDRALKKSQSCGFLSTVTWSLGTA
jgi:hypothetical protein